MLWPRGVFEVLLNGQALGSMIPIAAGENGLVFLLPKFSMALSRKELSEP